MCSYLDNLFVKGFPVIAELQNNMDRKEIMRKIYPLSQYSVNNIMDLLYSSDLHIKKAILFGSSISWRNHIHSDLDLAFIVNEDVSDYEFARAKIAKVLQQETAKGKDIIIFNELTNEKLKEEIEKGVIIYECPISGSEEGFRCC